MKKILTACLLLSVIALQGQQLTWAADIAPIFYENCGTCHNDGGVAPFPLTTHEEVSSKAGFVKWAIETGHMPPWPPDPAYRQFAFQRTLSDEEKSAILEWIEIGVPSGDLSQAPPVPDYPTGGELPGTPDLVLKVPTYTVQTQDADEYRCFVLPDVVPADKFITAWEIVPGNRAIVHHVVVYQDMTGQCAGLDAATPEPGYTCFGGACNSADIIGVWAPGGNPLVYPDNFGIRLKTGGDIVIEMHYPEGSFGQTDSTEIHFFFAPQNTGMREVLFTTVADPWETIQNGPFIIAPNSVKTFQTELNFNFFQDFTLLRVLPHMHLLGKSVKSWLEEPDGTVVPLIHIPQWDFHWQGMYAFSQLQRVKNGSRLRSEFTYDNTVNNPSNPNSPPQLVHYGESTTDEMLFLFAEYTDYQPGDENIYMDSSFLTAAPQMIENQHTVRLLDCRPNPASGAAFIPFYLPVALDVTVSILDVHGATVSQPISGERFPAGYHEVSFLAALSSGIYFVTLTCENGARKTSKFVVR